VHRDPGHVGPHDAPVEAAAEVPGLAACRKAAQPDMGQDNTSEAGLTVGAIPA
jgi:hypothetical protein